VRCAGLNAEWIGTIKTTTQFPVVPGTVVEVTCSELGALSKGSSQVTCVMGTEFSYSEGPSCSKPGMGEIFTKTQKLGIIDRFQVSIS
jgi:hypothetical protein